MQNGGNSMRGWGRPVSLADFCEGPLEIETFLHFAIGITESLAEYHKSQSVHNAISPQYIFIDDTSGTAFLVDPSSPTDRYDFSDDIARQPRSEVALPYLSPEQFGRINRLVDCRSDLYSLGITFYEMLTGRLPFQADDLLEWAHCHLARIPKSPIQLIPAVSPVISEIIMKLLEKTVEKRYQTAEGLRFDLKRYQKLGAARQLTDTFPLAEGDISDQLLIPDRLYGRQKDIDLLFSTFDRVVSRGVAELVMIAGYSGIGKTSLVLELFRPVVRARGFFVTGKFEQYRQNIPYATIIESFQELIRQILTETEERLDKWKKQLSSALGVNGQLIIDIIPQVELIIGRQPSVVELPATEAENRFHMVMLQFVGVFAKKNHPLVIFLDDLQWVDLASLKLIEHIVTDIDISHLLLIGAYRDNEVDPTHPLLLTLENISSSKAIFQTITLTPLTFDDVRHFIAATLHLRMWNEEHSLQKLIYDKTGGNPFFVIQFLMALHSEQLIWFDVNERRWKWDIQKIQAKGYTDNVVDLMTAKLQRLPSTIRKAMRFAACIGNSFDLFTLSKLSGLPNETTHECLQECVRSVLLRSTETNRYIFAHDRVQQAAYSLTPEKQRTGLHLQIGRLMLSEAGPGSPADNIFEIVNQLNLGSSLIDTAEEKIRVAGLNLVAGKKAKSSSAYGSAQNYFLMGTRLLDDSAWQSHYDLTFNLFRELAEAEYLNSNYRNSKTIIDLLLSRAQSSIQRAELFNMLIIQYTLMGRYPEAIQFGHQALLLLDICLPEKNFREELKTELKNYRQLLGKRKISSLVDEPELEDQYKKIGQELLANMLVPARYSDNDLFALIAVVVVNLSLEFGPTPKSTVGYTAFGMVLQSALNNYRDGYDFGDLALKISERFNNPAQKCQTCLVLGHYLNHWVTHLKSADDFLIDGFREGLAVGEMQWTGYCLAYKLFQPFYRGVPISQLTKEIPTLLSFTERTKNQWATDTLQILQLALSRLDGDGESLKNRQHSPDREKEDLFLADCKARKSFGALGRYAVLQVQIHFIFGRIDKACQALSRARELMSFFSSSISVPALNFYSSLIFAALATDTTEPKRTQYLQKIDENQIKMAEWANNCEENFKHLYLLVSAEKARLTNMLLDAEQYYEQAVEAAQKHGFIQNEALANELASRFYRKRKLNTIANAYLENSRSCYLRWGAGAKVEQLDHHNPQLQRRNEKNTAVNLGVQLGHLDAITVVKASQAISGEIVLSRLVETLMQTVIENGGAQKGLLILARGENLQIEARAVIRNQKIEISQKEHPPLATVLPVSMLNYVKRTKEAVIIDDASKQHMFSGDSYIKITTPISILCLPLLHQSRIIGMLYLENSSVRRIFTREKIVILEVLAAQAAISLENAALYLERSLTETALRESEEKYRAIFEDSGTPMIFIEEDRTVSICNKAFEKLSGFSRAEVEGKKEWTELVANREDLERMIKYHQLRRIDPKSVPQSYEFQFVDKVGRFKDVVVTLAMMPGTRKSLAVLLDITDRTKAIEALHQSERKFRAIFDRSFQFMGLLALDGTVLEINETALEFAETESSFVVGLPFWQTPWVNHSKVLQEKIRLAVKKAAEGELVRFVVALPARDKTLHYFDFSLKPVKNDDGKVVLIIPESRDITERKQAEDEQARLVTAIEQSTEAIFISDIRFIIHYANPALEKMSGFDREKIIGSHIQILAVHKKSDKKYKEMIDALNRGMSWTGRLFYRKKIGGSYEAEVTASPVRDKAGTVINYVSIHRDITREVQLEKKLRQAHKMEAIGTLAGGIAHDFNNILSVIQGHAQLTNLKLPKKSPLQNSLNQILVSCSRAKELVNQILAFSRQSEHKKKPIQLLPLVNEVLQLLRSSLPTTVKIQCNVEISAKQSTIFADATQIHQVLMNLGTNAAHAMGGQGGILEVRLTQKQISTPQISSIKQDVLPRTYIMLTVSDTGHGMDSSTMERIFDPYFTTKGPGKGSGIGLAVTRGIVEAHNGIITVDSKPGIGTQFYVFFLKTDEVSTVVSAGEESYQGGNERILFVDDEKPLVDMGKEILETLGYHVTATTSSQNALEIFQDHPATFDLVITDMTMPELTGTELAIKLMSIKPGLPVILCTGFSELVNSQQSKDLGIRQLLMKPWDVSEMAVSIRKALKQSDT